MTTTFPEPEPQVTDDQDVTDPTPETAGNPDPADTTEADPGTADDAPTPEPAANTDTSTPTPTPDPVAEARAVLAAYQQTQAQECADALQAVLTQYGMRLEVTPAQITLLPVAQD